MDQKTCNSSIHCTVENCAYHAPQNCCSLKSINVGCCDSSPTSCKGTECASFQLNKILTRGPPETGGPPYFPENYLQRRRRAQAEPWPCPAVAFFRTGR